MVDRDEPSIDTAGRLPWRVEIDLPMAAQIGLIVDKVDEASAEPAYGRNVDFAGPHDLAEWLIKETGSAGAGCRRVIDLQGQRAHGGAVGNVEGMGKTFLIAVDYNVDFRPDTTV